MSKERLDQLLLIRGLVASREKGRALIMAGQVLVNKVMIDKPGTFVISTDNIEIKGKPFLYVSRGGLKLEKALREFQLNVKGSVVLDIGASTGGFTHCALLNGATRVYAVDVGYGQLDWSLRQDNRVVSLERKNARYLSVEDVPEFVDLITIDVAFISLEKILPAVQGFLKDDGGIVALIKPQFEAGRDKVGKKGVVRDKGIHREVIKRVIAFSTGIGLVPRELLYSPITGPEGNIEYLLWLTKKGSEVGNWEQDIEEVLNKAHEELTQKSGFK